MVSYIAKRLFYLLPILIGITFLSFVTLHLAGGDAVTMLYENNGTAATQDVLDAKKAALGIDRPFLEQYFSWLRGMLAGDLGVSYVSGKSVASTFWSKLPITLLLTFVSTFLTLAVSLPLGVWAAVRQNRAEDHLVRFLSFMGNSMPNFFVALLLMYFLAIRWKWLPAVASDSLAETVVMPSLTLAIAMSGKYIRQIRAVVLEELDKDYVAGARARGVKERVILYKSVGKASLFSILTLLSLSIGNLLGGTAIVETIFMVDGVGKMAVDAIFMRDSPVLQAYVVWMAVIYVLVNLAADIIYHVLDPRVRLGGGKN